MTTIGARSDATKVLLGCPRRGPETVGNYPYDTVVAPGVAGCLNSSGEFVAGAAAPVIGISRGQSLSHDDLNSVTLKGKEVPLKLTDLGVLASLVVDDLTFTSKLLGEDGNAITITLADTATAGAETISVIGTAIVIGIEAGVSTTTQIKAAVDGDEDSAALVTVAIAGGQGATAQAAATVDSLEGGVDSYGYVVPGNPVFVDDTTGLATADDDGTTETNWRYDSTALVGVSPAVGGESTYCALVNM